MTRERKENSMESGEATLLDVMPPNADIVARDWFYLKNFAQLASTLPTPVKLLDLGAGNGASRRIAEKVFGDEGLHWRGVDIDDSAEHLGRSADAPHVDVYDGVNLPYESDCFDIIWCRQVLEHVRKPDAVLAEVARTLKPGGYFAGSVSQLEPYHSRSIFNWTHYGIRIVLSDHGLRVQELRPGVDGITLMMRAVFGYRLGLNAFFHQDSPFQVLVKALFSSHERDSKLNAENVYRQNLKTAGHIHFLARKLPGDAV
jgi:SAM-dependent methyltransferase